jgi:NAD-dependent dihydropyrimidine dehydrogenase PreA subunit
MINYENCVECGACLDKCKNGVYDKEMTTPKVIYPEGCVDVCRGCQNLCPADAIDYVGDNGEQKKVACQC